VLAAQLMRTTATTALVCETFGGFFCFLFCFFCQFHQQSTGFVLFFLFFAALLLACAGKHYAAAVTLIESDADFQQVDSDGNNTLHLALQQVPDEEDVSDLIVAAFQKFEDNEASREYVANFINTPDALGSTFATQHFRTIVLFIQAIL
jgi:hypothetical protein